jgi:hypothetical protein
MVLGAGPSEGTVLAAVNMSPTDSDAPRHTAMQAYTLPAQAGGAAAHERTGSSQAAAGGVDWLDSYAAEPAPALRGSDDQSSSDGGGEELF